MPLGPRPSTDVPEELRHLALVLVEIDVAERVLWASDAFLAAPVGVGVVPRALAAKSGWNHEKVQVAPH